MFTFGDAPLPRPRSIGSISPDHRYYLSLVFPPRFAIMRIDLVTKEWKILHQDPEILNPHAQFNPVTGHDILVQHNRGCQMDENGNVTRLVGEQGCTLYLIDKDGNNKRTLPIGPPYTSGCTGHECFHRRHRKNSLYHYGSREEKYFNNRTAELKNT